MALKYYLDYRDIQQNEWRIEIYSPTYTDAPITLVGSAPDTLSISWGDNSSDDPHAEHIIPSTATINIYNDGVDLQELQNIVNDDYKVRIYLNSELFWSGYLLSDGIQGQRGSVSYVVKLTATDGLRQLDSVQYLNRYGSELGEITVNGLVSYKNCPMNTIRMITQSPYLLDNPLPIRWMCNTKSNQYPNDDALAGRNELDPYGDLSRQENSSFWWIYNILKSQYCWMRQYKGYWYIINYKDLIDNDGVFEGWEIPIVTGSVTATPHTENMSELIHDSITGDGYFMLKKAYSNITTIYEDTTIKNNVIPNGSFDAVDNGKPLYWHMSGGVSTITSSTPINVEFEGNSCQVYNSSINTPDWLTFGSIPLDTSVLFKSSTLGFIFNPVSGYSVNGSGVLNPEQVRMSVGFSGYHNGRLRSLYLNENGYWDGFDIVGNNLFIYKQVVEVDYIDVYIGGVNSNDSQTYSISFSFVNGLGVPRVYNVSHTLTDGITSFQAMMEIVSSAPVDSDVSVQYLGDRIRYGIATVNAPVINKLVLDEGISHINFINVIFQGGIKQGDIVSVQFQSRGLSSDIKLANCGDLIDALDTGAGMLNIEFYSKAGTTFKVDDFYFTVSDSHDVYEITNGGKGSSNEYSLDISSSFSGHMISSYMNKYDTANKSMLWGNGKTLTELYGTNALNWLNRPNSIFQGSIPKMVTSWFTILDGKKYIPLTTTLNCHNIHTNVLLFEAKMIEDTYTITHKSSSDK